MRKLEGQVQIPGEMYTFTGWRKQKVADAREVEGKSL